YYCTPFYGTNYGYFD
nr:immunoglobulin heavy chain junction region [Mus musculus]